MKAKRGALLIWFVLGMLLGASLLQIGTSRQRMELTRERAHWQRQAAHWQREWTQLQEEVSRANHLAERHLVVQSVSVATVDSRVPIDAVEGALEPLTTVLLGLPLSGAKIRVLYEMFNGRVLSIAGSLYRIQVVGLLLAAESQLLVRVISIPQRTS
jgi:hypothetical protein